MSAKRQGFRSGNRTVIAVEPAPFGTTELRTLTEALADFAPLWAAELHGISVEEATLIVLPENGDDVTGPSFLLSREPFGYRVDQVHWDRMTEVGQYPGFADAVAVIRQRVSLCLPLMVPANATVH